MTLAGGSLERRIRRQLLAVLALLLAGLLVTLHLAVNAITRDFVLSRLQHDAENLIAALQRDADNGWSLPPTALPPVYQRVQSGHYYQLRGQDAEPMRSRSLWDLQPPMATLASGESRVAQLSGPASQHWLIWQQGFVKQGQAFVVWIAEDIDPLQSRQARYLAYLAGLGIGALLLLLWLQRRVLHRGFARLQPLQRALQAQQAGEQVDLPQQVPQEVVPLVEAIEQLLARSHERIARSRTALGNLAHELKRPLAQLQWLAEQAADDHRRQLQEVHDRLLQRIERELRRARIAGSPTPGRRFVPDEEIPVLVRLLERVAERPIDFASQLPQGALPYDRDDMLELLGNLLDNAWRHARSAVSLSIRRVDAGWCFLVEDDGNGVDDADLQRLTERGTRLDEDEQGHGIGLSICKAVVEGYDGSMGFERSPAGGLRAVVVLPG